MVTGMGLEPIPLAYEASKLPLLYPVIWRFRADLNHDFWFCRPAPYQFGYEIISFLLTFYIYYIIIIYKSQNKFYRFYY